MNNWKTYTGIALAFAGSLCPLIGAPVVVSYVVGALGTALGIYGRVSVGGRLQDEQAKVIELAGQLAAVKQYVKDGQRS